MAQYKAEYQPIAPGHDHSIFTIVTNDKTIFRGVVLEVDAKAIAEAINTHFKNKKK